MMSGKNKDGLRRKRLQLKRSKAFDKIEKTDPFDFRIDYSGEKSWQDCISRVAIAQSQIGVKSAMACMESVVRDPEQRQQGYVFISPAKLKEALRRMRKIYLQERM